MGVAAWLPSGSLVLQVAALFADINKAQPVNLIDMPGVAPDTTKQYLNEATEIMAARYSAMFSDSARCRLPHVNVDRLRDDSKGIF